MNRKEALIQMAQQRGVDLATAKAALEDADRAAIQKLLSQAELAVDRAFVIPKFIDEALRAGVGKGNILEIADVLLEKRSNILYPLARGLSQYADEKAVMLLRQVATLDWASEESRTAAGAALILAAHLGDDEQALQDPMDLVRLEAARHLEKNNDVPALIRALENTTAPVRRLAAWYMGRNKIAESAEALLALIVKETDLETLRAGIWALGVLRIKSTSSQLEPFIGHENALIGATAQEALAKLAAL